MSSSLELQEISVLSLNCWGLEFIAKKRAARLNAIADRIAQGTYDIVALQEIWVHSDFENLVKKTHPLLPYSKFYFSGVLGGGLAILSKWPLETTTMWKYPLNGRPTAFWRGDWYVGKGIGIALIRHPSGKLLEIFNTHMHAPYGQSENSYSCHRIAQAWEIAKVLRASVQRGNIAIGVGDFNMLSDSLAHQIVQTHGLVSDSWLAVHTETTNLSTPENISPIDQIRLQGVTCNSTLNTWRSKSATKRAKRLDYVFVNKDRVVIKESTVVFTEQIPAHNCSYSDHFGIYIKLQLVNTVEEDLETKLGTADGILPQSLFDTIDRIAERYMARAIRQSRFRIYHFFASVVVVVGLLVGQWWVEPVYGHFVILLGGLIVLATGIVDGMIGFIFGKWEIHALLEFMGEMQLARKLYLEGPGGL